MTYDLQDRGNLSLIAKNAQIYEGAWAGRILLWVRTLALRLHALLDHVFEQIRDAIAVAPFVVVPANQLEEALVHFDPGAFVENR